MFKNIAALTRHCITSRCARGVASRPSKIPLLIATLAFAQLLGCSAGSPPSKTFEYAIQGLYSAEFSANGEQVIIGSINHGGSLWNFLSNERKYNWNHKKGEYSQIIAAAFSPEGRYAITAKPQTMVLWDAQTGQGINYWTAPSEILDIELLPNGDLALLGLVDHSAALFDVKNGGVEQIFYHDGRVNSVAYDPASNRILSGSDDYSARLWDAKTGREIRRWEHRDEVQLVVFSPDGARAFSMAKYDRAAIWNTDDGSLVSQLPLHPSAIRRGQTFTAAAFSTDGQYLLTGSANRIIQLWEVDTMKQIKKWTVPRRNSASPTSAAVLALAFGPRGNYYTMTSDGFAHRLQ